MSNITYEKITQGICPECNNSSCLEQVDAGDVSMAVCGRCHTEFTIYHLQHSAEKNND